LIDTHCHLNDPRFESDAGEALLRARDAGVSDILVAGYDAESCRRAQQMAGLPGVWIALGVHPHTAEQIRSHANWLNSLRRDLLESPRVACAGEMGLDFHYNFSPPDVQEEAFRAQVRLAGELGLPVTIHSRAAEDRVMDILCDEGVPPAGAVLHAFTGTAAQAIRAVEMGLHIGVTGMVTFPKAEEIREMVRHVPLERMLVETDCPYLTPVPHRGRRNEPSYIPLIAQKLADVLGVSPAEVERQTTENALRVFARMADG